LRQFHDRSSALQELRAVAPDAVHRIRKRYALRVAAVPGILGKPDFLDGAVTVERR
jgi:hypothetical protein